MKVPFFIPYDEIYIEYMKTYEKFNIPVQQYHNGYEILFMINGERSFFYNDICYTLKRGDVAIIKPFELHCGESREVEFYERYVLNFKPETLECILPPSEIRTLFKSFNSTLLHLNNEQFDVVYAAFKLIDAILNTKNPFSQKAASSAILSLLVYLKNIHKTDIPAVELSISQEVSSAINYVNLNYATAISLDRISEMIHLSKYHFCRIFKKDTGITFFEYLNKVRLAHAHRLLIQSDMTINEIAVKTGFGSAAYFSRVFKKAHGISPKTARQAAGT